LGGDLIGPLAPEEPPEAGAPWAIIGIMNLPKAKSRIRSLREELREHNYRYYIRNAPVISDREYDQLYQELKELEAQYPQLVTPDSPTQRAGAPPAESFTRVEHPAPILSLDNAYSEEDLRDWLNRIEDLDPRVREAGFTVEPKLDGLTVVLTYQEGVFTRGATRGNSEVGEDITENLRTIRSLPLRIPPTGDGPQPPDRLVVRGEAFLKISDFESLNQRLEEQGERTYVNPRNTAAGSLRQLDSSLTAERPLSVLIYQVVDSSEGIPPTQVQALKDLQAWGFPVPENQYCPDLDAVLDAVAGWEDRRDDLDYEIDGAVVKVNDLEVMDQLGVVGKAPRGAVAYKYPAQVVTTRLEAISLHVGRTGVLTPYAVLEPVEIGGVTVRQATLHNFEFIEEKDIREGDRVQVKRAGDVIPYVIGPILEARSGAEEVFQPPEACPVCGEPVEHFEGEVAYYCVNLSCPAQLIRNLEHFVSRSAMDIEGVGIKIVEGWVEEGLVENVADLYTLEREELLSLEGFGEKKVTNLLNAVQASREQPLSRLLIALGIRGVGEVVSRDLAEKYRNLDEIGRAGEEELEAIEGIGPNIAQAVVDWFQQPTNQRVLSKLKKAGVWPESERVGPDRGPGPLQGKTFVVTGRLEGFTRREIKDYLQERGGKVTGSVSGSTDYLVVGENPGSKLDQAQAIGVPAIGEAELIALSQGKQTRKE